MPVREADLCGMADLDRLALKPLAFMLRYVRRHLVAHAIVLGSVVAAVAFATFSQYAIKHLVDVLSARDTAGAWSAFALLAALVTADNLSWRIGGWVATHGFVNVTGDMRRDLFHHLTGHAPAYFAERQPGTLASRISATANAIYQVENTCAWSVLPPALAVIFSIIMLATISLAMAGVLILMAISLGVVLARMAAAGRPLHRRYARTAAAVDGELVDVINNMSLVRAFGATVRERERFADRVDREMRARGESLRYLERLRLLHAVTTAVLTAGLLAWAISLWQRHAASTGDVVLVTTLGFTILHGTRDLAVALVDTVQHVARLAEALSTLLIPHEMGEAEDARELQFARGTVEFRHVTYAYPGTLNPVLRNFTLNVRAGSRVGLVGRSGSGKTTALALLQRLRDVQAGRILIDGEDIAFLAEASLREAISVVPQDVSLFYRSVMENIRYGRPDASDEAVHRAAADALCTEFIDQLPEKYLTLVGDRGVKLSGGQRQRLAIARAFLRDAPILLLDEATSALDSESEIAVQQALARLMKGRTVIAVAHRLSTLRDFDRIVVLQRGRIVQDGPPQTLEQRPGPYRDLLARQALRLVETVS
ncbi:MAG TPA: ABC transporter ATP-binding protein [Acetobacteraceae bacterium]|nr:ABC transporter ATP-binding protein [Acetobacteraceae bacterium]